MLYKPKCPAPEPYASAALWLLHIVALFLRNEKLDPKQVQDIGEAIHDIPESLTEHGAYFDEQIIRRNFLAVYDAKWVRKPGDLSLIHVLDQGIERVLAWQQLTPTQQDSKQNVDTAGAKTD